MQRRGPLCRRRVKAITQVQFFGPSIPVKISSFIEGTSRSWLCCDPGFFWSSVRSTKTSSTSDAPDSLRRIRSPWSTSYTQSAGRGLVRPLALGTALTSLAFDDELITLSFCRVNDVATLGRRVYTNEHVVPCDCEDALRLGAHVVINHESIT